MTDNLSSNPDMEPKKEDLEAGNSSHEAVALLQNLQKLIKANPDVRVALEKAIYNSNRSENGKNFIGSRPMGTYYKKAFAIQLRPFIDKMMTDKKDILFPISKFEGYKLDTLYSRIDQSLRYLINELDPDLRYTAFRKDIGLYREKSDGKPIGVAIRHNDNLAESFGDLVAEDVVQRKETNKWKLKLTDWLELEYRDDMTKEEKTLDIKDLMLSDEEVSETESLIENLVDVTGKIENNRIFLLKINPNLKSQ